MASPLPSSGDQELIQIVDAALADATRRSKGWLVCRKGCTPCCIGVFAINQLDAARLQRGLADLARRDPQRAEAVKQRAREAVARLSPCPALDPVEGTCDLYDSRPLTCRTFGPPVRVEGGGLGVCELCYQGCSEEEVAACEMVPDPDDLESALVKKVEESTGKRGDTIVAFPLVA